MLKQDPRTRDILEKYQKKIEKEFSSPLDQPTEKTFTRDYEIFRREALHMENSFYERACLISQRILNIAPAKKEFKDELQKSLEYIHLNVTPAGVYTFAILSSFSFIFFGFLIAFISFLLTGSPLLLFPFLLVVLGVILLFPLSKYPIHLAQRRRLQSSNQMVLCILYLVVYLRHTSNLEHAIKFAGEHLTEPLALDLRKILWDVETKKFATIQESLEYYLDGWKEYNLTFVESMHLLESSLYEGKEERRIELLEKALSVILEGTYDSMLHYAQEVRSPMTMLHMLGIILPTLGLIILPLIGSFIGVRWYHLAIIYNVILPILVFYFGYTLLAKRPIGYSQTEIRDIPEYERLRKFSVHIGKEQEILMNPKYIAIMCGMLIFLLGISPLIIHWLNPGIDFQLMKDVFFLGYKETETGTIIGPFGLGAILLSLFIPLAFAVGVGMYYSIRSKRLIAIREETKKLELEFRGAIFQLGNRIGGSIPAEMAFGQVSQNLGTTPTGKFFRLVDRNIKQLGMSVRDAIFNEKVGAMLYYPSALIGSSMKVLVESAQKGPQVVSRALLSIADYLDRIYKVSERLKDLLSEITSSMKAQISFLMPLIAGIVVGIGSMITTIIANLGSTIGAVTAGSTETATGAGVVGGVSGLANIFPLDKLVSPFFLQVVVGIYVVEMIIILSILSNGIENGVDKLNEEYMIGRNVFKGTFLYILIAGITIFAFNLLALVVGRV